MKAEIIMMLLQPRTPKDGQQPEASERSGTDCPSQAQKGTGPVDTLFWDHQPPELWDSNCLSIKPLNLWDSVMAAQGNNALLGMCVGTNN